MKEAVIDKPRAIRRGERERLKKRRQRHGGRDLRHDARALGRAVNTACPCSCAMCGNPRRWRGERPRQERRREPLDEDAKSTDCFPFLA